MNKTIFQICIFFCCLISCNWVFAQEVSVGIFNQSDAQNINRGILLATASLIIGESLLLILGNSLPQISDWMAPKNLGLALSDIALGGILVYISLSEQELEANLFLFICSGIMIITHVYRDIEYLGNQSNPFVFNVPLFILNNIRLVGLGTSLGISISLKLN
jgi:hypothetical protein